MDNSVGISSDLKDKYLESIPLSRFGSPEVTDLFGSFPPMDMCYWRKNLSSNLKDIANATLLLLDCGYISGQVKDLILYYIASNSALQTIVVDGGMIC